MAGKRFIKRRFLLQGYSERKRYLTGLAPAMEVYDGPAFRVLRRYLQHDRDDLGLQVRILSACFGLVAPNDDIPFYNERMTLERAASLGPEVCRELRALFRKERFHEILVNLGKDYLPALGDGLVDLPPETKLIVATGSIGARLRILKEW